MNSRFVPTRFRFCALALLVLLAACSGSTAESAAEANTTTTTEAAEVTPTTEAETTTTTPPTTTTTTTEAPTTTAAAEVDADDPIVVEYCLASAEADAVSDATDVTDPDAFRTLVAYQIETLSTISAPASIADDLEVVLDVFLQYPAILEPLDYDILAASDAIAEVADTPAFNNATDNLDRFEEEFCPNISTEAEPTAEIPQGITEDDIREFLSTPEGRAGIASGVVTTSSMTQEEALCFVEQTDADTLIELFQLGSGQITTPSPEGQAGLLAGLASCGLDIGVFG